jgi:probable rRNA maturation factor
VISYPQAALQAKKRGHQPIEEIQLLVIHGVLHLMGYDHGENESKRKMWSVQNQILDELGLDVLGDDQGDT